MLFFLLDSTAEFTASLEKEKLCVGTNFIPQTIVKVNVVEITVQLLYLTDVGERKTRIQSEEKD